MLREEPQRAEGGATRCLQVQSDQGGLGGANTDSQLLLMVLQPDQQAVLVLLNGL